MTSGALSIEELLAAALRGEAGPRPALLDEAGAAEAIVEAAIYHGVAGLLIEKTRITGSWPAAIIEPLTDQARAQAMWEMRHRQLLAQLLSALQEQGIRALLMKGTAVAYDLYDNPATRARGDTDLLVAAEDAPAARAVLAGLGYVKGILGGVTDAFALQQPWSLAVPDGGHHSIDLHWQVMNAPSLRDLLPFTECAADAKPLPRLSPEAKTMDRVRLLIHTCLHRAMHRNTPYFIGRQAFYDSGRLIWSYDIHLLVQALDDAEWSRMCDLAARMGVSRVCLDGLKAASAALGTALPASAIGRLQGALGTDRNSLYFVRSRALARAWQDLRSFPGLRRKLRYAASRILPDPRFVRNKYPAMANSSLPTLYAWRLLSLLRRRRGENAGAG